MIVTDAQKQLISVTVYGEFALADFKEFEEQVNFKIKFERALNLLFDLRQMSGFTLDVAWEEVQFARAHVHDFHRIAVLTLSQWMAWSAWLSQNFVDAEVRVFEDEAEARDWLEQSA